MHMGFFSSAINILQTLVVAIGAGLGVWGVINLMEGYREKRILSVSAFMTSTISWLRMKIKMQSLKTGVIFSITLMPVSIFS